MLTPEVTPLPAASVILVRDDPFEVLLLRRHEKSSFMPNAWVFPGGMTEGEDQELAREISDGSTLATMRCAAVREAFEESGIWLGEPLDDSASKRRRLLERSLRFRDLVAQASLDLESLVWTSRWITPTGVPKRFDTYFFVARVPREAEATVEWSESVEARWISPRQALEASTRNEMLLVLPTFQNLKAIAGFSSAEAVLEARRGAIIEPVQPVLVNGKPALPPPKEPVP